MHAKARPARVLAPMRLFRAGFAPYTIIMTAQQTAWVVSDGRAGIENQALGLAEAIAALTPLDIVVKRVRLKAPWRQLAPYLVRGVFAALDGSGDGDDLTGPPPDLWIGCGRQAAPLTVAARHAFGPHARAPFTVQLQDPRRAPQDFDCVVAPLHDGISGPNVITMIGAPNRVSRARVASHGADIAPHLPTVTVPRIGVVIGGPNRLYTFDEADAAAIIDRLTALQAAGSALVITTSRRTPERLAGAIRAVIRDGTDYFFNAGARDSDGAPNPYPGLFSHIDGVHVTPDSVNMMCEAARAGVYISLLPVAAKRGGGKFRHLIDALTAEGRIAPPGWDAWAAPPAAFAQVPPFFETERAARAVLDLWRAR